MASRPTYGITDLLECSTALLKLDDSTSMEEAAGNVVRCVRDQFVDKSCGDSALPLARLYITRRYDQLEPEVQDFARAAGTDARFGADVVCLSLLATAGEEPAWNDRRASRGHKAIPLPSVEVLHRSPMVAQLIEQLGLDPRHIINPDPGLLLDLSERTYNVFYVSEARDSKYIPAQEGFVVPYGIRSVVGVGGVLPLGSLYACVLFSRVPIPEEGVDGFAAIALSIKLALLSHEDRVFVRDPERKEASLAARADVVRDAMLATAYRLLDVRAGIVFAAAQRLEDALAHAEERAVELLRSQQALELSEARKAAVVEGTLECVIGMNADGRITDWNRAAEDTFGFPRQDIIGELLETIIPHRMRERHRLGLRRFMDTGDGPILGRRIEVNGLRANGDEFPAELRVTTVAGSQPAQFVGYVRDLTTAHLATAELVAGRERLAHIARTLQTSFLPAVLPEIDGFELAATFHAFGDGYEVGGDFYDVFPTDDGHWILALGDVCGKGSEAAVVTALARHTVRAAADQDASPAVVLRELNRAMGRQHPSTFCTLACAVLEPEAASIDVALGGHPKPLLLAADGHVRAVGSPGALIGPFEFWRGSPVSLTLGPGELLLLYSDGATEARRGSDFYGDDRLAATLASALGRPAAEAVHLLESEILTFAGELSDDIAMLAIRRLPD